MPQKRGKNSKEVQKNIDAEWEIGLYGIGHIGGSFCWAVSLDANRTD